MYLDSEEHLEIYFSDKHFVLSLKVPTEIRVVPDGFFVEDTAIHIYNRDDLNQVQCHNLKDFHGVYFIQRDPRYPGSIFAAVR